VEIFAFHSSILAGMSRYGRPSHRVCMTFMLCHGSWLCQFLEADAKTPPPHKLNFADPERIRELPRRGEALEHGIEAGRGRVWRVSLRPRVSPGLTSSVQHAEVSLTRAQAGHVNRKSTS
jgi:hypothetical protein